MPKTQPVTLTHLERFEQRLVERLAALRADLRADIHKDTEELLAEHHRSLTEAITDIILVALHAPRSRSLHEEWHGMDERVSWSFRSVFSL